MPEINRPSGEIPGKKRTDITPGGLQKAEGKSSMEAPWAGRKKTDFDPETLARLSRGREHMVGLRDRPLVSGMKARIMGSRALGEQFAQMSGASPEKQAYLRGQGAGMGSKILQTYGPEMATEAVGTFAGGMTSARILQTAIQGNTLFWFTEKVKNAAARQGIAMNEETAKFAAIGIIAGEIAKSAGKPATPATTT